MDATTKARTLRRDQTDAERRLWSRLRGHQLDGAHFRRQQPIGNYIVDFVSFEQRLVVELDGAQHAEQETYDSARTAWLESQGFRVMRFWNDQVLRETDGVVSAIRGAIERLCNAPPHPASPAERGGIHGRHSQSEPTTRVRSQPFGTNQVSTHPASLGCSFSTKNCMPT